MEVLLLKGMVGFGVRRSDGWKARELEMNST